MKFRAFLSVLIGLCIGLVSLGGAVFWRLTADSPLKLLQNGSSTHPTATLFIPKQTPLMVSLLVNPDELTRLHQVIVPPWQRREARLEGERIRQSILVDTGLDYTTDIQPWLGDELTFAITSPDLDRDAANGQQPGYLWVLTSRTGEQAEAFLQTLWQKRAALGQSLVFEQYAGIKLIYGQVSSQVKQPNSVSQFPSNLAIESLATAVVADKFVLLANAPEVLRQVINVAQASDLSLETTSTYKQAIRDLPANRVGLAFIDVPELLNWLTPDAARRGEPKRTEPSDRLDHVLASLRLDPQGLVIDTAFANHLAPESGHPLATDLMPVEAMKFLPSTVAFSASGRNLQQLWHNLTQIAQGYPTLANAVLKLQTTVAQVADHTSIETLLGWIEDEYALGLLPQAAPSKPDWILAVHRSDTTALQVTALDDLARRCGLSVGTLPLNERTITVWTQLSMGRTRKGRALNPSGNLSADVVGLHSTVGEYEIFSTSLEAMRQAIQAPDQSLRDSVAFMNAIAPLDVMGEGQLYIDWSNTEPWLKQQFPQLAAVELAARPLVDHLQSLAISSSNSKSPLGRGGIVVRLINH